MIPNSLSLRTEGRGSTVSSVTQHEQHARRLDRITDPSYLDGLADRSDDELHAMKAEASEVETEVSYVRRLAQGRIDVVEAHRSTAAGGGGLDSLIAQLPEILARDLRAPQAQARLVTNLAPDPKIDFTRGLERLIGDDSLVRLPEMSDEEHAELVEELRALEHDMSTRRKRLHEVIDAIDLEIGRRAAATQGT